jgi:hypothetical protein
MIRSWVSRSRIATFPPRIEVILSPPPAPPLAAPQKWARAKLFGSFLRNVGVLAGIAAVLLTYQSSRQAADITLRAQESDRFTKAIDQIGSSQLDVRLGGIYGLERLMHDDPDQEGTVVEVLSAYVREHSPLPVAKPKSPLALDIQAVLNVLQRRPGDYRVIVDLSSSDLHGARLYRAFLWGADLTDADLTGADLARACLSSAYLTGAKLDHAFLANAGLPAAELSGATLNRADLTGADLDGAALTSADLRDAKLSGANLSNVQTDSGTRLPPGTTIPWPPNPNHAAAACVKS